MSAFLADTNVVSELTKRHPRPQAVNWISQHPDAYISVLTLGELARGAFLLQARDPFGARRLASWVEQLHESYRNRILCIDEEVMEHWAAIPTTRTLPSMDSLLAATALANDLTVATRNVRDFDGTGVRVVNPFEAEEPASAP